MQPNASFLVLWGLVILAALGIWLFSGIGLITPGYGALPLVIVLVSFAIVIRILGISE